MDVKTIALGFLAGVFVLTVALLVINFWPAPEPVVPPPALPTLELESRTAGNVTVTATPIDLGVRIAPKFSLSFDTHSGSLDFDVAKITVFSDSLGASDSGAIWEGSPPGGHHRNGTLTFNKILDSPGKVKLQINNVFENNGVEFEW